MGVQSLFYFHSFFERVYSTARYYVLLERKTLTNESTRKRRQLSLWLQMLLSIGTSSIRQMLTRIVFENSEVELAQ